MSENQKKVFVVIGVIAAAFLLVKYVLPIVFKILGFVLSSFMSILMWVVIVFVIILAIGYFSKMIKK